MAIRRRDSLDKTLPKPGQWINKTTNQYDGICGLAREVVSASKSRVYYKHPDGTDEGGYCQLQSIAFVSDTQAEAQSLYELSNKQLREVSNNRNAIVKKFNDRIAAMLTWD